MSDTESFETTILVMRLQCRGNQYLTELCDILEAAHNRETEEAWKHGAALRDELVRLMGGASEPTFADQALDLMNTIIKESNERLQNDGKAEKPSITEVSDGTAEPMTTDEFIEFIEEDTRRLKGDASKAGDEDDTCDSQCRGACADCDGGNSGEPKEVEHERPVDDCVADTGCGGDDIYG